jgi:hypothetical protein
MLTFHALHGARRQRREFLRVGSIALGGLTLQSFATPKLARANGGSPGKAKACIVLFLMGGPPQHSTWDLKPEAAAEVRGPFNPISTNVPGFQVCELMPRLAKHADKLCVLKAMSTADNAHSSSGYYMMTGRPHIPMNAENVNPGPPNESPCMAGMIRHLHPSGELPSAIRLPMHIFNTDGSVWPGQDAGVLGNNSDPWLFRCEPGSKDFRIAEFTLPVEIPEARLAARANMLRDLNARLEGVERAGKIAHFGELSQKAFNLLASPQSREAFLLDREPDAVRDRYGRTHFGQSVLLARRLVEAGVKLVQVNWYRGPDEPTNAPCWDTHVGEPTRLKEVLIPPWDNAFSALLEDLHERGMLDETLIVSIAEFGRSPRLNAVAGRDHWGHVFSAALAGGGIRGGTIHGASDRLGAYPKDGLVKPEDLTATMLHCLGHSPETMLHDIEGRAIPASHGEVVQQVLA